MSTSSDEDSEVSGEELEENKENDADVDQKDQIIRERKEAKREKKKRHRRRFRQYIINFHRESLLDESNEWRVGIVNVIINFESDRLSDTNHLYRRHNGTWSGVTNLDSWITNLASIARRNMNTLIARILRKLKRLPQRAYSDLGTEPATDVETIQRLAERVGTIVNKYFAHRKYKLIPIDIPPFEKNLKGRAAYRIYDETDFQLKLSTSIATVNQSNRAKYVSKNYRIKKKTKNTAECNKPVDTAGHDCDVKTVPSTELCVAATTWSASDSLRDLSLEEPVISSDLKLKNDSINVSATISSTVDASCDIESAPTPGVLVGTEYDTATYHNADATVFHNYINAVPARELLQEIGTIAYASAFHSHVNVVTETASTTEQMRDNEPLLQPNFLVNTQGETVSNLNKGATVLDDENISAAPNRQQLQEVGAIASASSCQTHVNNVPETASTTEIGQDIELSSKRDVLVGTKYETTTSLFHNEINPAPDREHLQKIGAILSDSADQRHLSTACTSEIERDNELSLNPDFLVGAECEAVSCLNTEATLFQNGISAVCDRAHLQEVSVIASASAFQITVNDIRETASTTEIGRDIDLSSKPDVLVGTVFETASSLNTEGTFQNKKSPAPDRKYLLKIGAIVSASANQRHVNDVSGSASTSEVERHDELSSKPDFLVGAECEAALCLNTEATLFQHGIRAVRDQAHLQEVSVIASASAFHSHVSDVTETASTAEHMRDNEPSLQPNFLVNTQGETVSNLNKGAAVLYDKNISAHLQEAGAIASASSCQSHVNNVPETASTTEIGQDIKLSSKCDVLVGTKYETTTSLNTEATIFHNEISPAPDREHLQKIGAILSDSADQRHVNYVPETAYTSEIERDNELSSNPDFLVGAECEAVSCLNTEATLFQNGISAVRDRAHLQEVSAIASASAFQITVNDIRETASTTEIGRDIDLSSKPDVLVGTVFETASSLNTEGTFQNKKSPAPDRKYLLKIGAIVSASANQRHVNDVSGSASTSEVERHDELSSKPDFLVGAECEAALCLNTEATLFQHGIRAVRDQAHLQEVSVIASASAFHSHVSDVTETASTAEHMRDNEPSLQPNFLVNTQGETVSNLNKGAAVLYDKNISAHLQEAGAIASASSCQSHVNNVPETASTTEIGQDIKLSSKCDVLVGTKYETTTSLNTEATIFHNEISPAPDREHLQKIGAILSDSADQRHVNYVPETAYTSEIERDNELSSNPDFLVGAECEAVSCLNTEATLFQNGISAVRDRAHLQEVSAIASSAFLFNVNDIPETASTSEIGRGIELSSKPDVLVGTVFETTSSLNTEATLFQNENSPAPDREYLQKISAIVSASTNQRHDNDVPGSASTSEVERDNELSSKPDFLVGAECEALTCLNTEATLFQNGVSAVRDRTHLQEVSVIASASSFQINVNDIPGTSSGTEAGRDYELSYKPEDLCNFNCEGIPPMFSNHRKSGCDIDAKSISKFSTIDQLLVEETTPEAGTVIDADDTIPYNKYPADGASSPFKYGQDLKSNGEFCSDLSEQSSSIYAAVQSDGDYAAELAEATAELLYDLPILAQDLTAPMNSIQAESTNGDALRVYKSHSSVIGIELSNELLQEKRPKCKISHCDSLEKQLNKVNYPIPDSENSDFRLEILPFGSGGEEDTNSVDTKTLVMRELDLFAPSIEFEAIIDHNDGKPKILSPNIAHTLCSQNNVAIKLPVEPVNQQSTECYTSNGGMKREKLVSPPAVAPAVAKTLHRIDKQSCVVNSHLDVHKENRMYEFGKEDDFEIFSLVDEIIHSIEELDIESDNWLLNSPTALNAFQDSIASDNGVNQFSKVNENLMKNIVDRSETCVRNSQNSHGGTDMFLDNEKKENTTSKISDSALSLGNQYDLTSITLRQCRVVLQRIDSKIACNEIDGRKEQEDASSSANVDHRVQIVCNKVKAEKDKTDDSPLKIGKETKGDSSKCKKVSVQEIKKDNSFSTLELMIRPVEAREILKHDKKLMGKCSVVLNKLRFGSRKTVGEVLGEEQQRKAKKNIDKKITGRKNVEKALDKKQSKEHRKIDSQTPCRNNTDTDEALCMKSFSASVKEGLDSFGEALNSQPLKLYKKKTTNTIANDKPVLKVSLNKTLFNYAIQELINDSKYKNRNLNDTSRDALLPSAVVDNSNTRKLVEKRKGETDVGTPCKRNKPSPKGKRKRNENPSATGMFYPSPKKVKKDLVTTFMPEDVNNAITSSFDTVQNSLIDRMSEIPSRISPEPSLESNSTSSCAKLRTVESVQNKETKVTSIKLNETNENSNGPNEQPTVAGKPINVVDLTSENTITDTRKVHKKEKASAAEIKARDASVKTALHTVNVDARFKIPKKNKALNTHKKEKNRNRRNKSKVAKFTKTRPPPPLQSIDFTEDVSPPPDKVYTPCEFKSKDPLENEDNNDPMWTDLEKLSTDSERYRKVRQRWKNLAIPDPNKDLTFRHRGAKQPPRPSVFQVNPAKRQRSRSFTSVYEEMIAQAREEHQKQIRRVTKAQENDMEKLYNAVDGDWSRKDREVADLARLHSRKRRIMSLELDNTTKRYQEYMSEARAFQSFYQGLGDKVDKTLLTTEQLDLHEELEAMYSVFNNIYK